MSREVSTIHLSPKTALYFGLVKEPGHKGPYVIQVRGIREQGQKIRISLNVDGKSKTFVYPKNRLTPVQHTLIAWIYLLLSNHPYSEKDPDKEKAAHHLRTVILDQEKPTGKKTPLPYYLASVYNLDIERVGNVTSRLYQFLDKPDELFYDFFLQLFAKEDNPIRKLNVARIAAQQYPKDESFIAIIARDFLAKGELQDCREYLQKKKAEIGLSKWKNMSDLRLLLFECFLEEKLFNNALEETKAPLYGYKKADHAPLLKGIIFEYQKLWEKAISFLEEAIRLDTYHTAITSIASYHLLPCYYKIGDIPKIDTLLSVFILHQEAIAPWPSFPYFEKEIEPILAAAIHYKNISELSTAKLKGMLAFILTRKLPNPLTFEYPRKLTKEEQAIFTKALKLVKESLEYFPQEYFFNALCSNLLFYARKFDEAMHYKLRAIAVNKEDDTDILYPDTDIDNCSDRFLREYAQNAKYAFESIHHSPQYYIRNKYVLWDIAHLWERKLYKPVAELYYYVHQHIRDFGDIDEIPENDKLFEIAYSLKEIGDDTAAAEIYEQDLQKHGDSSAVLNNLGIIYEEKGDLEKAKGLIKKAHEIDPANEVAARNEKRLSGPIKDAGVIPQEQTIPQDFTVQLKDREIWVNEYFIAKPYFGRAALELYSHIREQAPHTKISRENLPEFLQKQIGSRKFGKLLESCGFTKEIRKAFFYELGPQSLKYRGNTVTAEDLQASGVKVETLMKQLDYYNSSKQSK